MTGTIGGTRPLRGSSPGSLTRGTGPAGQVRHELLGEPGYPLSIPWRTRAGEVGNVVFGRMDDPVLLVQVDHRRLDVRVAQHGLDLPNRGPMVQGQRGGRMAERMGRDRTDR